jgi:hypothetical protein
MWEFNPIIGPSQGKVIVLYSFFISAPAFSFLNYSSQARHHGLRGQIEPFQLGSPCPWILTPSQIVSRTAPPVRYL